MEVLTIFIQLMGFYFLYNTSNRAVLRHDRFSVWLQERRRFAKLSGCALLVLSLLLIIVTSGIGSGLLKGVVYLMTIGSMVIIFTPLKTIRD